MLDAEGLAEREAASLAFRPVRQRSQKLNRLALLSQSIFVTVRLQPPETANILGTDLGTKPGGREWDG